MKAKKEYVLLCLLYLAFPSGMLMAQESEKDKLGLPGDNLNLAAVLDVFRHSPTLEDFESALNSDTSRINNLDLNNNGKIDYIKVMDNREGDLHAIVLQVDMNENESQDLAVIYVEKKGEKVTLQVVGDEELYGKDYIIEPSSDQKSEGTPNPAYEGDQKGTVINNYYYDTEYNHYNRRPDYCPPPSSWLIIQFMYGPAYVHWHSPWHWDLYPVWWTPWSPWYWDQYYHHWYYQHSWQGWWYWRSHHHHFNYYYGSYNHVRRHSDLYRTYRSQGVYRKTYDNPKPQVRPATKANFPSHSIRPEDNPAIVRPGVVKPVNVPKDEIRKPPVPAKDEIRKPPVKPSKGTETKPETAPKPKPSVRPSTPVKRAPATGPVIKPRDTETKKGGKQTDTRK